MREVAEYETGRPLGRASDKLAQASDDAVCGTNGVVAAYYTTDAYGAVWDYLPNDRVEDLRRAGYRVASVYVNSSES